MPETTPPSPRPSDNDLSIIRFEDKEVRRHWDADAEKWYFSVIDVIGIITESSVPKRYWTDLKKKLGKDGFELYEKIVQLKFAAKDGKKYATECTDTETLLRVIQSIPSPKAEPIKQWLARVGFERIEEIKDPEKGVHRAIGTYARKGYDDEWIGRRMRTIEVRNEVTTEWKNRGIEGNGYAILTNDVYRGWSGMTSREYRDLKKLTDENLRDHMSPLELILNMLAEASTAEIARTNNAQGFEENRIAAQKGSGIAGNARNELEQTTGKPVITPDNFLPKPKEGKELE